MTHSEPPPARAGSPRSPGDAAFLTQFEWVMEIPLALAAVLPILMWLVSRRSIIGAMVYVASWLELRTG